MDEAQRDTRIFRFGIFELDGSSGELRREGKELPRLRDQALQILLTLLERPRTIVTREELHRRLWPSDTFVDFDHGLNTAINQLRNALGDSAANPRFIQTLPRRGYRFIAPVEIAAHAGAALDSGVGVPANPSASLPGTGSADEPTAQAAPASILSSAQELPRVSSGIVRILFSLIQVMYLGFYVASLARLSEVEIILARTGNPALPLLVTLIVTAAVGIPIRLYLLSGAAFNYRGLSTKFQKLFPFILLLDGLWALAPFLIAPQIGMGLALAATAALLYLPFAQRSLLLMGMAEA
ncbi:MAG: winged helix-turn-helix domain-containing protein [Acidobacteriia bacterium]|nr:winged helix-turn-helix domain-containing protein [Terriglobia bacterium]